MIEKSCIVLDNNVVVSAGLVPGGVCSQILNLVIEKFQPVATTAIVRELAATLLKPKFARYGTPQMRSAFLMRYTNRCTFVSERPGVQDCRDPDDDKFLAAALEAHAALIVSGDNDLLVLHPWRGIPILNPADALKHLA